MCLKSYIFQTHMWIVCKILYNLFKCNANINSIEFTLRALVLQFNMDSFFQLDEKWYACYLHDNLRQEMNESEKIHWLKAGETLEMKS